MRGFRVAPAVLWRAFFLTGALATDSIGVAAPLNTPPPLKEFGQRNSAEAKQALDQLRHQGIAGNYYLEFQLRIMPRRGEERLANGRLWGGRNASGPLTRVSIAPPTAAENATERRLLIQNGARPAVWRWETGKSVEMVGVASLFEPIVPNTELTAFDLQMPFIFWNDFTYEGVTRFRGRPAYVIRLRPPADFAAKYSALSAVRVHLDTQFNALVQTEIIGLKGAVVKTLSLVDLKKIDEQWIPKTFDLRDEPTRNKTRLSVTGAALNLEFSPTLFEPAELAEDVRSPVGAQLMRVEP